MRKSLVSLAAVSFLAVTSAASAAVLFTEDFNYADGELNGKGGWTVVDGNTEPYGVKVEAPTMSYTDGSGNTLQLSTGAKQVDGNGYYSTGTKSLGVILGTPGTTAYLSALVRMPISSSIALRSGTTDHVQIAATSNATNFIVLRLDFGASTTTITQYMNPTNLLSEAGNTSLVSSKAGFAVDTFAINGGFYRDEDPAILKKVGEIRIASTWYEVAPVPEPTSLAVIGLASTLLMRRRRAS